MDSSLFIIFLLSIFPTHEQISSTGRLNFFLFRDGNIETLTLKVLAYVDADVLSHVAIHAIS